jgi:hypothetical protein
MVGHPEIFSRMTEENPALLAPSDKIEPINVFGREFSVERVGKFSFNSST